MADRQEGPGNGLRPYRTVEDLHRAVRAVAAHFKADEVFVIGSQAILAYANDPPTAVVTSMEVDIYLANTGDEISEEINALFGFGSQFEQTHGFYIDGVDERTASLPPTGATAPSFARSTHTGGRSEWWYPGPRT